MTNKEYEEQMEREVRMHWFPEHKSESYCVRKKPTDSPAFVVCDWRKPDTGIFAVRYVIDRKILAVTGDVGCAVFRWSEGVSFDWLADCGLSYFAEKCEASEDGRPFMQWHEDVAKTEINRIAKDLDEQNPQPESVLSGIDYHDEDECRSWLMRHWDDHKLEAETMSNIMRAGRVISPRCIGMWVGLKMIKEQQ